LKYIIILLFFFMSGCCFRGPRVPVDLQGVMEMEFGHPAVPDIRGMFTIEASRERFVLYVQDTMDIPRGKIVVEEGRVGMQGVELPPDFAALAEFWPFILGSGRERDVIESGDMKITYSGWQEHEGYYFPGLTEIDTGVYSFSIKLFYAD